MQGQIRVGRRIYDRFGKYIDPSYEGFIPIIVMTKSTKYGSLNPYELKDSQGRILENLWQFSKVYSDVPKSVQTYSRYDKRVIWQSSEEVHATLEISGNKEIWTIEPEYFAWRKKGMYCNDAIRYPVGYNHRHKCIFSLKENEDGTVSDIPLDYIQSRKAIYLPLYIEFSKDKPQFLELKSLYEKGKNLLIIEVDACHQEDLKYYMEKYNVSNDFIVNNTMLATQRNLEIMLNDEKHPFGHGYCLASALQNIKLDSN